MPVALDDDDGIVIEGLSTQAAARAEGRLSTRSPMAGHFVIGGPGALDPSSNTSAVVESGPSTSSTSRGLVPAQRGTQAIVQDLERHRGVFGAGEYQERRFIFLSRSGRPLLRGAHDEHDGSQIIFGRAAFDPERRRKESFVRIAGFVAVAWRRRSYVRRHTLSQHVHPFAAPIGVAVARELKMPESRVDAHDRRGSLAFRRRFAARDRDVRR